MLHMQMHVKVEVQVCMDIALLMFSWHFTDIYGTFTVIFATKNKCIFFVCELQSVTQMGY